MLDAILSRHGLDDQQKQRIEKHAEIQKQRILAILELGTIEDEIPGFTSQEFKENPPTLELSGVFCETDFSYTEEEYAKHLQETESFAEQMENYTCKRSTAHAFRNLQILIHKLNPFVCHRRKPTTFRWWEEPCEPLAINPDSQYTFV